MTEKKRIAGVEVHFDAPEERVDLERTTERNLVPSVPRPTPRSQVAATPAESMRAVSDSEHKFDATVTAVGVVFNRYLAAREGRDADVERAVAIIARDQGLEAELPPRIKASLPPPAPARPPARTPLRRIDRRTRLGMIAAILFALLELEAGVERLVNHFEHRGSTERPR